MNAPHATCIDFEPGLRGRALAAPVAQTLRIPLLNREITAGAARKLNVSEMSVATLGDELDRAKRLYVKQAFGLPWPDSRIYDLVIDVGSLPLEQSAPLVAECAGSARGGADYTQ
jgi:hypothetical protein